MSKKDKTRKRHRKKLRKLEERSDRRTAEFLVARLDELQTDLGDLIPDLQAYDHYCEIMQVSFCLRLLAELRKKYQKHADGHPWDDS
jgi:hypothetical protein